MSFICLQSFSKIFTPNECNKEQSHYFEMLEMNFSTALTASRVVCKKRANRE
jgi:hypothetical protein